MQALRIVLLSRPPPPTVVCSSADVARLTWAAHVPAAAQPLL